MAIIDKNEKWAGGTATTLTPQAKNDGSTTTPFMTISEDSQTGGLGVVIIKTADLMANDLGGSAKNFYAVEYDALNDAKVSTSDGVTITYDANGKYNYLAAGQVAFDTFNYTIQLGNGAKSPATVTMKIVGVNDAAVITGDTTRALAETDAVLNTGGKLSATDVDSDASFQAQSSAAGSGGYGKFTIGTDGTWTYAANTAHNEFVAGTVYTDTLTVKTADGTSQLLTVTITGTNDAATITGTATGGVTEDDATKHTASGTLTITDVDTGEAAFRAPAALAGTYGAFTFEAATGKWGYTVDDAKAQFLGAGKTTTDKLTVTSLDGTATQDIVVTITGTNDLPSFALLPGDSVIDVVNDRPSHSYTTAGITQGGTIHYNDPDGGSYSVVVSDTSTTSTSVLGHFSGSLLAGSSAVGWGYSVSVPVVEALRAGEVVTERGEIRLFDGADSVTQQVSVTLTGANDLATISGNSTGTVAEDGTGMAGGTLAVADVDTGENTFSAVGALAGQYGTFTFADGTWGYVLDNAKAQVLAGAQTVQDKLTVASLDGTASKEIVVTVTGKDDAPAAVNDSANVDEDNAIKIDVVGNDTDIDGGPKEVEMFGQGANGVVTKLTDGSLQYKPNADFNGADSFTYSLNGGKTATVSVNVAAVDDAPVAVNDSINMKEDGGELRFSTTGNDSDPDGGPMSVASYTAPSHGRITDHAAGGSFAYVPNVDFFGSDSFTYTLNGGSTATVSVTVDPVNDAPTITFTGGATATTAIKVAENSTSPVATISATDTDGPAPLIYSIGASPDPSYDNSLFKISSAGDLQFISPPDFEFTDPGNDDLYKVQVSVKDGAGAAAFRDVFVQVTDVLEETRDVAVYYGFAVDTGTGYDAEATNMVGIVREMPGTSVSTFGDFSASGLRAALVGKEVMIMPEQERGTVAIDAAAEQVLEEFVGGGGTLIAAYDTKGLINTIFEWDVSISYSSAYNKTAATLGTSFADDVTTLFSPSATLGYSALPSGSLSLYEGSGSSAVVAKEYGEGQVVALGWDYFNAAPVGSYDGGWKDILKSAVLLDL